MRLTWQSISMTVGALVSVGVLIGMVWTAISWIDNHYIDTDEARQLIDKQTKILGTMNDNIVSIGKAIYDRKLAEIDQWIKDLEHRTDRNAAEDAFLKSLKDQRTEVLEQKENLGKIKIGQ